ncbi:hypothetical protein PMSD_08870 [Paenibacillus macquariensis subsp. defensor]|nr:hypothetical protein PMSD_08870 [Paenibacillus macquariensis subsp. defensor]
MQRFKKSIVWIGLLSLIMGLFPIGTFSTASAADLVSTTYFAPEDRAILATANLDPNTIGNGSDLRTKVKVTNSPTIAISGTFSKVSSNSLSAQIDLMSWDTSTKSPTWIADKVHSTPGIVMVDNNNDKRFNASSLTLFPGLNRITFKGKFGSLEGSETFYVLYDKIPYFSKLSIMGSGFPYDISLNEGTRVVVKNPQIYLAGEVYNATKATVTVNGGSPLSADIYDNQLTTSPLKLNAGLNKLSIKFTNGSDSIEITRDVYYFTDKDPFIDLRIIDNNNGAKTYDLLNNVPVLKDSASSAPNDLIIQMMLPYSASGKSFEKDHVVTIDKKDYSITMLAPNLYNDKGEFAIPTADAEEVIIDDSTGPLYRLVTFQVKGVAFKQDITGTNNVIQKPEIQVNYGAKATTPVTWNFTASYNPSYKLSGKTAIKSMKYLPDYTDADAGKVTSVSQLPLNNAKVAKSDFYIMVETDGTVNNALKGLKGKYLPLGNKELTIVGGVAALDKDGTVIPNTYIYKISGFATGEQKLRFEYADSSPYDVTISYSSISGILVDNLQDGQTYSFNSSKDGGKTDFVISGEYFGFNSLDMKDLNPEYFINGLNIEKEPVANHKDYGSDVILVDTKTDPIFPKFKLSIYIAKAGPLVAGENTIEFRGQYRDAAGNLVPVSKKLRIYIVDENVANVAQFHPGKVPQTVLSGEQRAPFPTADQFKLPANHPDRPAADEMIKKILAIPTEFTYKDEKYTTSELSYDLVLRGSGATKINLLFGTEQIFSVDVPVDGFKNGYYPETGTNKYFYEIIGTTSDFLLRVRNNQELGDFRFDAETTGTHVYNLELINKTGARTNQRLEITRELAPYRLLAPQPTVGDQYVVNKNFVRFDIEAEGATKVIIGKEEAIRRTEPDKQNRFTLDYVGLKADKSNKIKIQIVRGTTTINDTIDVFYTSQVNIDSQFMVEKPTTKYSIFNKKLELTFPKGTIMQSAALNSNRVTKYYPDTKLLFGIADPKDGVVERRNDYGVYIDKNTEINNNNNLLDSYKSNFTSTAQTFNFTRVSDIYWISGGVGELGDKGTLTGYKPATNGLAPYSTEGIFTAFEAERKIVPSQRGTLKISYDNNVVDEAGTLVTVFKYTDVGGVGKWARVPGEVNSKAHTVTVPFDEFGYYAVYKLNRSFSDITNHPWARNILNALYSKGIMDYLRADAFGADDQTTRGEFATLIVKGLNLPINTSGDKQTFFDVPYGSKTTTWDFEHLETASRAGIITGRTEGFFSPNMPITRQDAAVMIARALKLKLSVNDQKLKDSMATSFLDSGKIDYYALPAIQAVTKAKIMSGNPITLPGGKKPSFNFNPTSNMTRAEAGKIAVELFKKSTNIFPKNFN